VLVQVTANAPRVNVGEACTSDRQPVNGKPDSYSDSCLCERSLSQRQHVMERGSERLPSAQMTRGRHYKHTHRQTDRHLGRSIAQSPVPDIQTAYKCRTPLLRLAVDSLYNKLCDLLIVACNLLRIFVVHLLCDK